MAKDERFRPVWDMVHLKPVERESKIAIPTDADVNQVYEVIAMGAGLYSATGERMPPDEIKVGDLVAADGVAKFEVQNHTYYACRSRDIEMVKSLR